jgi:hypothetical protein
LYGDLTDDGYSDVFSIDSRILYRFYKLKIKDDFYISFHQYVMPVSALLLDAKSRNKLFEDILKQENF